MAFLAGSGAQTVHLTVAEAPSAEGCRRTINAFLINAGVTLLVLRACSPRRPEAPLVVKALAAAVTVFLAYILRHYRELKPTDPAERPVA